METEETPMDRIFNEYVHDQLVDLGFVFKFQEEEYEDAGDGESGPMVYGHPAWNEYESADWRVIVDHDGVVQVSEARDLAFEKFVDEMSAQYDTPEYRAYLEKCEYEDRVHGPHR